MNRARLQFATTIFLGEMRRQAAISERDISIKKLDDYPAEQRSALMSAVEKAINSADPAADTYFENWLDKRNQETEKDNA